MTLDSRHLVDPELAPLLDIFPTVELNAANLKQMRERDLPLPPVEPNGVAQRVLSIPGPAGAPDVGLHIYTPPHLAGPAGCIFHIHGGGYVSGSAGEMEFLHRPLAAELGCVIVSVDYRLAPETRFPGAIEDIYAALGWTFASAADLGIDPERIGVMGESAGGGYAAALALLARDSGEHRLAFQHLIYPMLDDRTCVREPHPYAGQFIWPAGNNRFGWWALLGHAPGAEGVSPYAAPARAEDLTGLPPTFISTGALDLFVDEDVDYARRLNRSGVAVELHVYPGAFHGFDLMPGAAIADAARRDSRAALRRFLARES